MSADDARLAALRANAQVSPPADDCSPADRYQELFVDVQQSIVFADSKTFVDCAPRLPPAEVLAAYRARKHAAGFDLAAFVHEHFIVPEPAHSGYRFEPAQTLAQHIDSLWPYLTRQPQEHPACSSLLPLPHPYVVPGGRFAELYYWDSFFTMLGLSESGLALRVHQMTDNFAYLIDTYGHVPNGTRTYYLSRSQPPVFALMTRLCEEKGGQPAVKYLPQLLREHAFWMDGEHAVPVGHAHRRVVKLADGTVLNRYWDDRCTPREESWREDVATAASADRPHEHVYRDLRAAAESGWDFSTRWLREADAGAPAPPLSTICTTDLLPVDLNTFMHAMEHCIARLAEAGGDAATQQQFDDRAQRRAHALRTLFWREADGYFADYDWRRVVQRRSLTAATVVPLYCMVATQAQADAVARIVGTRLLAAGGIGTSEVESSEQWDRPNGWAPLQWMASQGFDRYGHASLALEIRKRWLAMVQDLYDREGKLVEKYTLRESSGARAQGGDRGEYPLQDGFGWTNGVTRRWLHEAAR